MYRHQKKTWKYFYFGTAELLQYYFFSHQPPKENQCKIMGAEGTEAA
jgi:hypothetical protein